MASSSASDGHVTVSVEPLVADGAHEVQQIMAAQDQLMQQQDQQLDGISRSLGTMKNLGLQIRGELDMQNSLLTDIDQGIDRTTGELRSARTRMTKLLQRSKDCKWIIAILVLVGVVIFLLSWVFRDGA